MRRLSAVAALVLALMPAGCASPKASGSEAGQQVLPAGWRWESYGGVEVGVPGDWGWGISNQRLGQWCVQTRDKPSEPIVGRPGFSTQVGCGQDVRPRPETLIANTGLVLAFDREAGGTGERQEGDQTAVRLGGVVITVNAPQDLRDRVVKTIRPVEVDSYGCPVTHAISLRPEQRPPKPVDVGSMREVTSVSVCTFPLGEDPRGWEPRLLSAARLEGASAEAAIRGIVRAPRGSGPNDPKACLAGYSYGDDAVVLLVHSAAGVSEIVFRYSGCDHHGFDDGLGVRRLTTAAIAPFLAGPMTVGGFSPEVSAIVPPRR